MDPVQTSSGKPGARQAFFLLAIAAGLSAALVGLFLRGGFGLGLTLAVVAAEAGLWLYHLVNPDRDKIRPGFAWRGPGRRGFDWLQAALTLVILFLGSSYVLYGNLMLHILNFPVILYLFIVQSLLLNGSSDRDWDEPLFWLESGLAALVRPFVCLHKTGWMVGRLFSRQASAEADPRRETSRTARKPALLLGQVMLGVLLAVPVLLLTGSLLASADSVFNQVLSGAVRFWQNLSIQDRLADLALTLILFPFIFSYLESCRSQWQVVARRTDPTGEIPGQTILSHRERILKVNPVTLIAFLASINLLYLIFSLVQLAYLTGAFRFILPAGLTYAEYARKGFFELAGIAPINVALVLLAVKGAGRTGLAGRLLRIQSLLLVAGSLVQLLSAMFRMVMYVNTYGLTLMRFFVSAFMILIAALLILLTIKEFRAGFPLFKASAIAVVLSLVLLNAVNADVWIARFNIEQMITRPNQSFDLDYFRELSPDAIPILVEALPRLTPSRQQAVQIHLASRYQSLMEPFAARRWQDFNWPEQRALQVLALSGAANQTP